MKIKVTNKTSNVTKTCDNGEIIYRGNSMIVVFGNKSIYKITVPTKALVDEVSRYVKNNRSVVLSDNAKISISFNDDAASEVSYNVFAKIEELSIGDTHMMADSVLVTQNTVKKAFADMNIELYSALSTYDGIVGYAAYNTETDQFVLNSDGDLLIHTTVCAMLTELTSFVQENYIENLCIDFEKTGLNGIFKTPHDMLGWRQLFGTMHHVKTDNHYIRRLDMLTDAAKQQFQNISSFYDDNINSFDLAYLIWMNGYDINLDVLCKHSINVVPTPNGGYRPLLPPLHP